MCGTLGAAEEVTRRPRAAQRRQENSAALCSRRVPVVIPAGVLIGVQSGFSRVSVGHSKVPVGF